MSILNPILIQPLASLFSVSLRTVGDPGLAAILFSLGVRFALVPLYWVLYGEERKLRRVQARLKPIAGDRRDLTAQAERVTAIYREEHFNPFSNFLLQLSPLPVLIAMVTVFRHVLIEQPGLVAFGLIPLNQPSLPFAILTIAGQLLSLRGQPPETRRAGYMVIGVIGIVVLKMPLLFTLYWLVVLGWTTLERKLFARYQVEPAIEPVRENHPKRR